MNRKTIRATVVRALAAGAMVAGLTAVATTAASASGAPATYYAAYNGSALNAPCTNKAIPCTVAQALASEAANAGGSPGSVIVLLPAPKGIAYTAAINALDLSAGNDNVTIEGKKAATTILNPSAAEVSPDTSVVDFSGVTGVVIRKVTIEQTNDGFSGGPAVLNAGVGTDTLESSTISNEPYVGIAVAATSGTTNISSDTFTVGKAVATCQSVVSASPNVAGSWSAPGFVNIKKFPKCAKADVGDTATVDLAANTPPGVNYVVHFSGPLGKQLTLTSPAGPNAAIPTGTKLIYGAGALGTPAFQGVGISASGSATVNVDPTNITCPTGVANPTGPGPIGINATAGATLNVAGGSVNGCTNADFSPSGAPFPAAEPGIGISSEATSSVLPTAVNISGGTSTTGDDLGVSIAGDAGDPGALNHEAVHITGAGPFSANDAGIVLANDDAGVATGDVTVTLTGNSISGSLLGAGLELKATVGQTLGNDTGTPAQIAANQNLVSGNGVGVAFGELELAPSFYVGSLLDNLQNADITGNAANGVELAGAATPAEYGGAAHTASDLNTITHDIFNDCVVAVTNPTGANCNGGSSEGFGANIADYNYYEGPIHSATHLQLDAASAVASGSPITTEATGAITVDAVGGAVTIADGEALQIAGLPVTVYIDLHGAGNTHTINTGNTDNIDVNVSDALQQAATAAIPGGTAFTAEYSADFVDGLDSFTSNTTAAGDNCSSGAFTDLPDSAANVNFTVQQGTGTDPNPGVPVTTTGGGYSDC